MKGSLIYVELTQVYGVKVCDLNFWEHVAVYTVTMKSAARSGVLVKGL